MQIIKKLVIRYKLKQELERIDAFLNEQHYYELDSTLYSLRFKPEEYACMYEAIENAFRPALDQKHKLQEQIQKLSGKNLFVRMNLEQFLK